MLLAPVDSTLTLTIKPIKKNKYGGETKPANPGKAVAEAVAFRKEKIRCIVLGFCFSSSGIVSAVGKTSLTVNIRRGYISNGRHFYHRFRVTRSAIFFCSRVFVGIDHL